MISDFYDDFPPISHKPALTRDRIARNMGLATFFEIEKNYRPDLAPPRRSDFQVTLVKPKNAKPYQRASWAPKNSKGVKAGTRIGLAAMHQLIEEGKRSRAIDFVEEALGVSRSDASDVWREIEGLPPAVRSDLFGEEVFLQSGDSTN